MRFAKLLKTVVFVRRLKRVALINPRGAERNSQNLILQEIYPLLKEDILLIGDDTEYVPHLGLLSIASLFPEGVELFYLDEEYIPLGEVEEKIFRCDFDLVCLTAYNPQAKRAYEIAKFFKDKGIPVIMGGLHVSGIPEEAANYVDSVFIGEAEDTFREFLLDFARGDIKKFYIPEEPVNLYHLPPPRFDIIPNFKMYNKIPLIATRGCPHKCDFCIFPVAYHSKFRHKKVEQVIQEIEMVKRLHPSPFISFSDENMLVDREFAKALLREMVKLDIPWECYCDVGIAEDEELLHLLYKSKCQLVQIGFETVDPENLKNVDPWKYKKIKNYSEYIAKIQKHGIPVMAMFIAGFDNDTPDVFKNLKQFIIKNRIMEIDFALLTPMPGTPLFQRLKREGRIITENWDHYTWTHVNFQPMKISAEKLQRGPLELFKYFTERPQKAPPKEKFIPKLPYHIRNMPLCEEGPF